MIEGFKGLCPAIRRSGNVQEVLLYFGPYLFAKQKVAGSKDIVCNLFQVFFKVQPTQSIG